MRAISHAYKILDWFENLLEEEIPPEWMWPFDDELEDWFDKIKRDREDKHSSGRDDSSDSDSGAMLQNELTKDRR